jgi:hypothetical protein
MNPAWCDSQSEWGTVGFNACVWDQAVQGGRDAVIFLIDCTAAMFEPFDAEGTYMSRALKVRQCMHTRTPIGNLVYRYYCTYVCV